MKVNLNEVSDDELTKSFREAVQKSIEDNQKKGLPVCRFDATKMKSYILYPDGRKEYANA